MTLSRRMPYLNLPVDLAFVLLEMERIEIRLTRHLHKIERRLMTIQDDVLAAIASSRDAAALESQALLNELKAIDQAVADIAAVIARNPPSSSVDAATVQKALDALRESSAAMTTSATSLDGASQKLAEAHVAATAGTPTSPPEGGTPPATT